MTSIFSRGLSVCLAFTTAIFGQYFQFSDIDRAMFKNVVETQSDIIAGMQLPSGAITLYENDSSMNNTINPYFSSLACLGLLEAGNKTDVVKKYINWHFDHINKEADTFGIAGTIYDYSVNTASFEETSTQNYDSSDSYAAVALGMMKEYCVSTGDTSLISGHESEVRLIVSAMNATRDNGLSWCKPGYNVKYLMDNSEVAYGLDSAGWLFKNVFNDDASAQVCFLMRDETISKIETEMWNSTDQSYAIGMSSHGLINPDLTQIYPGASAQLFPMVFGLSGSNSSKSEKVVQKFINNHPNWVNLSAGSEAWSLAAYGVAKSGDFESSTKFLHNVKTKFEGIGYGYPWNCAEAGFAIRTALELQYQSGKQVPKADDKKDENDSKNDGETTGNQGQQGSTTPTPFVVPTMTPIPEYIVIPTATPSKTPGQMYVDPKDGNIISPEVLFGTKNVPFDYVVIW